MLFEKTMKCFGAIAAVYSPQVFQQEFLVDSNSGAGRNLVSSKDMPVQWNGFVADAPEQLRFATGGGIRPSSKAVKLKGEISGEGIFYTLKHGYGFQINCRFSFNLTGFQMSHSIVLSLQSFT